jgi:V-type H+-transporting ATPase subunit a
MMFGDLGHGSILFFFAAYLCVKNEKLKGTTMESLLPMRFMLLAMGFMASYCGLLYNEFFALPMNLFPSCYNLNDR